MFDADYAVDVGAAAVGDVEICILDLLEGGRDVVGWAEAAGGLGGRGSCAGVDALVAG